MNRLRKNALEKFKKKNFNVSHIENEAMKKIIEELKIHQIELEMQNEELKAAQFELRRSTEKYERLYHNAPFGYVTLNNAGIVENANETFCNMIHCDFIDIKDRAFFNLIIEDDQKLFLSKFKTFFKNFENKILEVQLKKGNDDFFYAELQGVSQIFEEEEKKDHILLAVVDITKRKITEIARNKLIDELQKTIDNVKTLEGLLPICSFCKKVRKDDGYWEQIDQ